MLIAIFPKTGSKSNIISFGFQTLEIYTGCSFKSEVKILAHYSDLNAFSKLENDAKFPLYSDIFGF